MNVSNATKGYRTLQRPCPEPVPQESAANPFDLLMQHAPVRRHAVRAGAPVYRSGSPLQELHLVRSGVFKVTVVTWDGREKLLALQFPGQWLGFDAIAEGRHVCEATAVESGELWSVRYDDLVQASVRHPALAATVHRAMSDEMARDRDAMKSLSTLSADARVAKFLRGWIEALEREGERTDRITLHLTRAEIGNYLGLTLESVSRAFSRLAREEVIRFAESTHREVEIRDVDALSRFVQPPGGAVAPAMYAC